MRTKRIICLLLAGILLVLAGAENSKGQVIFAERTNKKGTLVTVDGSVYDAGGQLIIDRFALVEASTEINENGGAGGDVYVSGIDENGKYHLQLPAGYYYFHFHFHNRSIARKHWVGRSGTIDLSLEYTFYQMSGKVYLNGQPYRNGVLRLKRIVDDPEIPMDDYFTDIETDENGYYEFCFFKGVDGDFSAEYQIKGVMRNAINVVNLPGENVSGYDISISGDISQDPLPTNSPADPQDSLPDSLPTSSPADPQDSLPDPLPTSSPADSKASSQDSLPIAGTDASPMPTFTKTPDKQTKTPDKQTQKDTVIHNNSLKKGMTFTQKGLRYRITSCSAKRKEVILLKCTKKNVKKVVIPTTVQKRKVSFRVTGIGSKAFCYQKKLDSVLIGKNVQEVGLKAFYRDSTLKKVVFKTKKLTNVGTKAFVGINNNARIVIPKSCKKKYVRLLKGKY